MDVRQFQLKVVNLPRQVSYSFVDPATQARLSQLNFSSGVTRLTLGLRLFLPERPDEQVRIDQPLEFWALVLDEAQAATFREDRAYADADVQASRAGFARLALVPRGVGRIEVSAPSLFSEVRAGEAVEASLVVRNTGSRRLDNVKMTAETPINWQVVIDQPMIPALEINAERTVRLRIQPPPEVGVGDYEVRLKSESYAYNRLVPSEDKVYRVSVKARTNLVATLGLLALLVALVVGIIVAGVKLTRR